MNKLKFCIILIILVCIFGGLQGWLRYTIDKRNNIIIDNKCHLAYVQGKVDMQIEATGRGFGEFVIEDKCLKFRWKELK